LKEDRLLDFDAQLLSVFPSMAACTMSVAEEGRHFMVCCDMHSQLKINDILVMEGHVLQ